MRCNVPKQPGKRQPNKIALAKNSKKIAKVLELGKRFDELTDLHNRTDDPEKKAEIKAKMDATEQKVATMSAEINAECFKKTKGQSDSNSGDNPQEETEISKEVDIQ